MTSPSDDNSGDTSGPERSPGQPSGNQPEPTTDPEPAVGPGGVDAKPDWEDAGPDAVVPDPPRSAQLEPETVPDKIDEPEGTEVPDSDGASEDLPSGTEEPAD